MRGHVYKNFFIMRPSIIFVGVMQLVCSAIYLLMVGFTTAGPRPEENAETLPVGCALCYFMVFYIVGFATNDLFGKDERPAWVSFSATTPSASRGQVLSKYYCLLAMYAGVSFCCFITDSIASIISYRNAKIEVGTGFMLIVLFFSIEVLFEAVEIPFVIRFGSGKGIAIKGAALGAVLLMMFIYFLFGDISFILNDDVELMEIVMKFLASSGSMLVISLLPYIALAAYFISYKIAHKVYRKGAESYGQ